MKRKEQKEKTRNILFDTALSLFFEKGYENVSVDLIVKEAGLSKGAFYHHFISKEAILVEFVNIMLNDLTDNLIRIVHRDKASDFQKTLDTMGKYISSCYLENIETFQMLITESKHLNFSLQETFINEVSPIMTGIINTFVQGKQIRLRSDSQGKYITTLIFLVIKTYTSENKRELEKRIEEIFDVFIHGIFI